MECPPDCDRHRHLRLASRFESDEPERAFYLPVAFKYVLALTLGVAWTALSVWLSQPGLDALSALIGRALAIFIVTFIAFAPGFMNASLVSTFCLDRRPERRLLDRYPAVSILVACYNEEGAIADTIRSLAQQTYPGPLEILILDDGSTDATMSAAREAIALHAHPPRFVFTVVSGEANQG